MGVCALYTEIEIFGISPSEDPAHSPPKGPVPVFLLWPALLLRTGNLTKEEGVGLCRLSLSPTIGKISGSYIPGN
jgi:hypothetical protein